MDGFLIVVEKATGNYSAYAPDLPGCVATGETREEAQQNMREAIAFHIEGHAGGQLARSRAAVLCGVRSRPLSLSGFRAVG